LHATHATSHAPPLVVKMLYAAKMYLEIAKLCQSANKQQQVKSLNYVHLQMCIYVEQLTSTLYVLAQYYYVM